MSYVLLLGFNLTRATAYTKVMNFASNVSSLAFFLAGGKIHFLMGLTMGIGQLAGGENWFPNGPCPRNELDPPGVSDGRYHPDAEAALRQLSRLTCRRQA
jgi:hypothetical protein